MRTTHRRTAPNEAARPTGHGAGQVSPADDGVSCPCLASVRGLSGPRHSRARPARCPSLRLRRHIHQGAPLKRRTIEVVAADMVLDAADHFRGATGGEGGNDGAHRQGFPGGCSRGLLLRWRGLLLGCRGLLLGCCGLLLGCRLVCCWAAAACCWAAAALAWADDDPAEPTAAPTTKAAPRPRNACASGTSFTDRCGMSASGHPEKNNDCSGNLVRRPHGFPPVGFSGRTRRLLRVARIGSRWSPWAPRS